MLGVVLAVPPHDGFETAPAGQQLAGLTLLARCALDLQRLGAERLLLVVAEGERRSAELLAAEARLHAPVELFEVPPGAPPWAALAERVRAPFVLLRHDVILHVELHRVLDRTLPAEALGTLLFDGSRPIGPMRARPPLLEALARDEAGDATRRSDVTVLRPSAAHWAVVGARGGARHATRLLLDACRKPVDGIVSRHLNRHVSLAITRLLLPTPITPNAMTLATFGVALLACWFALGGDYRGMLIGAALMQLGSILDGCDGELARVRYQGSRLGQWLDTIGDDASNVLFWAALGVGTWGPNPLDQALAVSAWVAAGTGVLVAAQYYLLLAKLGSGDLYDLKADDTPPAAGLIGRVVAFGNTVLKQDFFLLLLLLLAVAGLLRQALPLFAVGGLVTLVSATARSWRAFRRRPAAAQPNNR